MHLRILSIPLLLVLGPSQGVDRVGRLDATRAFFYPRFAGEPARVLARTKAGDIDSATYLRYLAGRFDSRYLEDLAFQLAVAEECKVKGLARSAPLLARSLAARRFHESGRRRAQDPDGALQRKFTNESLQQLRLDALAGERRSADPKALEQLFHRLYGVGGHRVRVRQVMISFAATERRLRADGKPTGTAAVIAAAEAQAKVLARRAQDKGMAACITATDERTARRMLRDDASKARAGVLEPYNFMRYGEAFAAAVRGLEVGGISAPVRSELGIHLVELQARQVTPLTTVEASLRQQLRRGPAKPADIRALRQQLLRKYGFNRD